MRIEPNTFYISRNGCKVFIFGLNPFHDDGEGTDWVGVIDGGQEECWQADGSYFTGGSESPLDLVKVWSLEKPVDKSGG